MLCMLYNIMGHIGSYSGYNKNGDMRRIIALSVNLSDKEPEKPTTRTVRGLDGSRWTVEVR